MKAVLSSLLVMFNLTVATLAFSHSDHHHPPKKPVTEDVAKKNAQESVNMLIKTKKIENSWTKSQFVSLEKKRFGSSEEWVATYLNKAIKDTAKQKLFIFMRLSGEFLAANYTGK
ncbi:MAG: DUF6488 family protein [Bdellovibrionota bacterium]